ncbi:MAG: glycosyltransferase [Pseudonocardiaceae bacterium]
MSRFLFVVPPLIGHTLPTVAVGRQLARRGHQLAWAGDAAVLGPLLPPGTRLFPIPAEFGGQSLDQMRNRSLGLRGAAAFRFLWADFLIPLATSMVPGVRAAVREFAPDVVVADQQALAGALVGQDLGLPWATSATTSAELTDQFATMPRLGQWAGRRLHEFQHNHGVSDPIELRFSHHLVLAFTTAALAGPGGDFPSHYVFAGPALAARTGGPEFPWGWLDPDRQHVLVSLGTLNQLAGRRFLATAVQALTPLAHRLQAIVIGPPGLVGAVPDHVLVRERVPQLELLAHLDAVISHAGHNTVCEALAHGVPLVVAPIRDDQPVIAQQVVSTGAGIRVHFGRVGPPELRNALTTVLDDPSYRSAAQRVQISFAAAGGAAAAADHLEKLL